MKRVLVILMTIMLTSGCAHYGKGASSFNLKLHEQSPYGDTLKGMIDPHGKTTLPLGKYVLEHNDIQRKEVPIIDFEFEAGGVSVQSCKLSHETDRGVKTLAKSEVSHSTFDAHTYFVSFDTGMTMEALSKEVLVVTCDLIEDKAYIKAKAKMNTIPRNHYKRALYWIPWFRPQLDGGEHELEFESGTTRTARW